MKQFCLVSSNKKENLDTAEPDMIPSFLSTRARAKPARPVLIPGNDNR